MRRFVAVPVWCFSLATLMATSLLMGPAMAEDSDPFGRPAILEESDPFGQGTEQPTTVQPTGPKQPRIWVSGDSDFAASDAIRERFLTTDLTSAGLEFQDTPLEEVVDSLRDEYQLGIHLDVQGLDDLGLDSEETVNVNLRSMKLGAAICLMLKPLELTYYVSDGLVVITSEDESLTQMQTAIYPVADLISDKDGNADFDHLIDDIVSIVASNTWAENGGGEAEIRPYLQRGALVVLQTARAHDEVLALLAALRQCEPCPACKSPAGKLDGDDLEVSSIESPQPDVAELEMTVATE